VKLVWRLLLLLGFYLLLAVPANAHAESPQTRPAAFLWYQELAGQGDVEAQYNLGMMCETGWGVAVDTAKAVRWYREAAGNGHAEAQFRLGMLYYLGLGAQQSDIKGQRWIRSAAKQGHGLARALYDKVFADQPPSELDVTNAVSRVRQAYLKNESEAAQLLDQLLAEARRREQQQQALEEETTLRERRAMRTLAGPAQVQQNKKPERIESVVPEFIGDATLEENRTLARGNIATIRVQAEKGLASSQYNLGRMYELGIKVPIDKTQALAWYKKAALQGYPDAEYRLAIALLYGSAAMRDERRGKKWLAAAAKHDHPVAKNLFANFVDESGARHHNTSIVVNWYMERALAGEAEAALRLGRIFEHGWGATVNTREARSWYKRASLLGAQQADEYLQSLQTREAAQVTDDGQGSWFDSLKARLGLGQ
jgi:hypothetical protein